MKTILSKMFAVGGVIAVCAALAPGAFAQDFNGRYHDNHRRFHIRRVEERISMLQAAYAHDVAVGNFSAAARDHRRAQELRASLRAARDNYGYRDDRDFGRDHRF